MRWGLRRAAEALLEGVLPLRCPGCGRPSSPERLLCPACDEAIPRVSLGLCARCLSLGREPVGCRAHPGFSVWPRWVYDRRAEAVIHAFKYAGLVRLGARLGVELAQAAGHLRRADVMVEMPLHAARLRERGYNQSALLAEASSRALHIPRLERALSRRRPTRAQARLSASERRDNVRGAFRVERPEWLRGREVLVVDDVITTGATFAACFETLIEAGARPVGLALAWAQ